MPPTYMTYCTSTMDNETVHDGFVSLVVPVYRSAQILPKLTETVASAMHGRSFELVLVCDASPDESWEVIRDLTTRYAFVRGICLRKNAGQHNAIMAGL